MKAANRLLLLSASIFLAVGLAACEGKPGPAESAGRKIDQAANDTSKKVVETVDKASEKVKQQGAITAAAIDDAEITTRVKAAIFAEAGLKTLQIGVTTTKGVVTLSGSVDSPARSETARSLAAAVSGVVSVDNKLAVKP